MLKHSISSEHFRRRNSVPGKAYLPATRTTDDDRIQTPKSPVNRTCFKTFDQTAALKTPVNGGPNTLALPLYITEGPQKPSPETNPQHISAHQRQIKHSTTEQQLAPVRLSQHQPHPSHAILIEASASSLDSPRTSEHDPPIGFFTARAAESLQHGPGVPMKGTAFNPHLESPSIRKTAGVDHTKTKPVGREAVGGGPQAPVPRVNYVNPQSDKTRRVGMPMGAPSPLQNRGSYKPPQMKRSVENSGPRLALSDVTNVVIDTSGDVKRQKVGQEAQCVTSTEAILES